MIRPFVMPLAIWGHHKLDVYALADPSVVSVIKCLYRPNPEAQWSLNIVWDSVDLTVHMEEV